MTIVDRLLAHDAWSTRQLLLCCRDLTAEQMGRQFDVGGKSLAETFEHLIACMESHTDTMLERVVNDARRDDESVDGMLARLTEVAKDLADVACRVEREGRADELVTNPDNGKRLSLGGLIAHVVTHSMHHRAQIHSMLEQLGVPDVMEGDVLGWEAQARGWGWADGGSYGTVRVE